MNPVSVEIRNVALSYGATPVLRDISLAIEPGEFFALLGPSGSGKTTLLRLIAGFNQHQKGEVLVGGRDVTGTPPWKRDVGMVFQNYALWPHMSVDRNVAFGLEERRLPRATIRAKVTAVLVSAAVRASVIARGSDVSPSAINRATLSWYEMSHLRRSELLAADQFSRTERRSA